MIASFDLETRGLSGAIFRGGYYDKKNGYTYFNNGVEFMDYIHTVAKGLPFMPKIKKNSKPKQEMLYVYAFNLEFDFSKILSEFKSKNMSIIIDYDKSLIINNKFHTVKIKDINIQLCDIYPIVNTTLDNAAKSFELDTRKMEIDGDKETYFKNVSHDDVYLNEYLKSDVIATNELVYKVIQLSGLDEEQFVRCPTTASLAMKIFKELMSDDFKKIKDSTLSQSKDEFIRKAYFGGRVEVFKNLAKDCYHYDVNSLYPSVMQNESFPVGVCGFAKVMDTVGYTALKNQLDSANLHYIIDCTVEHQIQNIGLLPIKQDGKLIFPTGVFRGTWTNVELNFAIKNGVIISEIHNILFWLEKDTVFNRFVSKFRTMKEESVGAKRFFSKMIQNSLYGKFAMKSVRTVYEEWTEEKMERLNSINQENARIHAMFGQDIIVYDKTIIADYIRPHYSCFITAYARVKLLSTMLEVERSGGKVYYCDTDSLVCDIKLNDSEVSDKLYGLWKLEREVFTGVYILPKLYAEISHDEVVLKSKGIVKQKMMTVNYSNYIDYYNMLRSKTDLTIYDEKSADTYYTRRKIIAVLCKKEFDFDDIVLQKKRFLFSKPLEKRVFDYDNNTSLPHHILH